MARTPRSADLDPQVDYHRIYRDLTTLEFPWDFTQALGFALFRTYAVPSIGQLLHRTREFEERTQKRYDDTALLLEVPLLHGFDDERGRAAVRRINQMHKMYDISNDDMRYVLATFVVVPKRWIDDYGWRRLTDAEVQASVLYYRDLGRHMAIADMPESYEGFAHLMDEYESEHYAYDDGARKVADATLELMASFQPALVRPAVDVFSRSVMDDRLLRAFRYRRPNPIARMLSRGGLKVRAAIVARMAPRTNRVYVHESPQIKSYPNGFAVRELGTFAGGCPVDHRRLLAEQSHRAR
ncbi:ER-bound oxygenase mpaB/mpaB'/Rubber oxygenase catalytic domain-containing protein OS=Tsukamurella paurometabola (strain ATCC 8368 / DSM / CCUG 35730 /CIP 100753 / JCM 10117 / KCTC 9821 / NBRC 16120 / NCIMB 702349/ NCTC 13040) OX=521096 GN=Tpau_2252 PE=4 SV=1 [Tsukamurella paurometabola]|uniref:ER-bound oxygenase mpaB/mpaB'/Rubber oxygenase catalytic domain-containing protein n=1 Tax=Tsukamurella paurometabola (strain ATCC 8368 / DSM 20162 / CCUG 35730 / CIP 100753 / JCM 10117 / KCTC 9821 / NBRC 16120 / NCIMB 702349 / NCTC 13040) TaxID=521096 RepID=D5UQ91_TSUPD|nr:oxygenase MpaB family protein [Tsukamurella paurometabola]ADG78861.1 conserved hypothetical protein [Tsukamurella paurometabola DSM 20162]SUP33352.1 Uncharacterized protein conserved in bacteria (DUF2236) [Tsukamurella paurometabola]